MITVCVQFHKLKRKNSWLFSSFQFNYFKNQKLLSSTHRKERDTKLLFMSLFIIIELIRKTFYNDTSL